MNDFSMTAFSFEVNINDTVKVTRKMNEFPIFDFTRRSPKNRNKCTTVKTFFTDTSFNSLLYELKKYLISDN